MSWVVLWLYFVIGELTVLLALSDDEGTAQVQWLAQKGEWIRYIGGHRAYHRLASSRSSAAHACQEEMIS